MSLSRRGFLKGLLGLVAGIAGSRIIGTPPPVVAAPGPPAPVEPVDVTTTIGEYVTGEIGYSERFRLVGFQTEPVECWTPIIGDGSCRYYAEPLAYRQMKAQARLNRYKGEILHHAVPRDALTITEQPITVAHLKRAKEIMLNYHADDYLY